jgi:catechol 2,3-dioxygenase-like lactoylglutathione lyase family enzyme
MTADRDLEPGRGLEELSGAGTSVSVRAEDAGADRPVGITPSTSLPPPVLSGIHHVTISVSDVQPATEWFETALGFVPVVTFEEEDCVTGVLLEHPSGAAVLVRADPAHAVSDAYPTLTFAVPDVGELRRWDGHLTGLGISHTEVTRTHLGWAIRLWGPERLEFRLVTNQPLDGVAE